MHVTLVFSVPNHSLLFRVKLADEFESRADAVFAAVTAQAGGETVPPGRAIKLIYTYLAGFESLLPQSVNLVNRFDCPWLQTLGGDGTALVNQIPSNGSLSFISAMSYL